MASPIPFLLARVTAGFKNAPPTNDINPFTTDDCSQFPEGTLSDSQAWKHCCLAHDFKYWAGGTYEDRLAADDALKTCVAETGKTARVVSRHLKRQ